MTWDDFFGRLFGYTMCTAVFVVFAIIYPFACIADLWKGQYDKGDFTEGYAEIGLNYWEALKHIYRKGELPNEEDLTSRR